MDQQTLTAIDTASNPAQMPHPFLVGTSGAMEAHWPVRLPARLHPLPELRRNPLVLPMLLSVSLGMHIVLVALSAYLPEPAEAAVLAPSQVELNLSVEPVPEETEALPEPEPEPEPEPRVVQPQRAAARPDPTPAPAEPAPPAPVMVAQGTGASGEWGHDPGQEGGQLGGTPGGAGTAVAVVAPIEAVAPRTGLSRQELRRRVLAYIRGTLSSFVNGRLEYPLEARRNHLEGVVVLRLRLDEGGELVSVRLSRTSGHQLLDRAALARVQNLHSVPAPPGSIPWDSGLEIPLPVTYRLQ